MNPNDAIILKEVLSHELSTILLSLFHTTGEMRKTNKSQLLKKNLNELLVSLRNYFIKLSINYWFYGFSSIFGKYSIRDIWRDWKKFSINYFL